MTRGERGEGRIGLILALAVVGVAIFVGVKIVPVRVNAYEFRDYVEQECRMAAIRDTDATIMKRIMEKAEELELPLDPKNLKVRRTTNEVVVTASYVQPIDLKVTVYNYRCDIKERAPLF